MELGLARRTFIVTGAARGLGAAIALRACEEGAQVVLSDADGDAGDASARALQARGHAASFIVCDVTDPLQVKHLMDSSAQQFGGVDVLVNNAGVHERQLDPAIDLETMPVEVFDRVFAINLRSAWLGAKYALPYLRRSSNPSIINAASTAGLIGYPLSTAYGATKGAMVRLTEDLAVDLARFGIRVNAYCPGAMRTRMVLEHLDRQPDVDAATHRQIATHLVHRLGDPSEVADLVCFLASDRSRFINGAAIRVDGGSLAWRGTVDLLGWRDMPPQEHADHDDGLRPDPRGIT